MSKTVLSKVLAVAGTVLVGLSVAFTVVTSAAGTIAEGRLLFDYMMPAELFLVVLAGGLLLLWAALRVKQFRKSVIIGLAGACVFLAVCQLTAVVSGLESGETTAEGPILALVIALLVAYIVAVVWLDVAGILLTTRLFTKRAEE